MPNPTENTQEKQIFEALSSIYIEDTSSELKNSKAVSIKIENNKGNGAELEINVHFHYPNKSQHLQIAGQIEKCLKPLDLPPITVNVQSTIKRHQVQSGTKGIPNIKNIIAVGSGKGGVGKSTVSVNLARSLILEGAKVGLLDADIYGPSIPTMLNIHERPTSPDGKTMTPLKSGDLKTMSIGYLTEQDTPMIWRGPIVTNTLKQLLSETNWEELDYLIIDLPPGTGDTQLTLAQSIPVSGAIIVTTPQNVALADARKAIRMFEKVNIHTLGVVENMSDFTCPHCGKSSAIFKSEGGTKLAEDYMIKLLGKIPLNQEICETMDRGVLLQNLPPKEQQKPLFDYYRDISRKATAQLSQQPVDFTAIMPAVEIKNLN
jgi:ATP-binding protein involved in chromosome partitioning